VASDVDIAENARFKFQIIQPALNNVTYADNASQLTPHGGHHAPVQNAGLLAQHPADNEKRSTNATRSGKFSMNSLMRASNLTGKPPDEL
jgi:hypothetical protein